MFVENLDKKSLFMFTHKMYPLMWYKATIVKAPLISTETQWLKWGGLGLSSPAPIWAPRNSMSHPPDWIYKVLFYA